MNKLNVVALLAALGYVSVNAAMVKVEAELEVETNVVSCNTRKGDNNCSATIAKKKASRVGQGGEALGVDLKGILGSVGEFEQHNIVVDNAIQLGDLNASVTRTVEAPAPGESVVFEFTPKTGDLKDQAVYLAVKRQAKKLGGFKAADQKDEQMENVLARLKSGPATKWYNAAEVTGPKEGIAPITFAIGTDGTIDFLKPKQTESVLSRILLEKTTAS